MAYKHSPYAMKKLTFMMLLAAFFTLCCHQIPLYTVWNGHHLL